MKPRRSATVLVVLTLPPLLLWAGCVTPTDADDFRFAGDWCTLRTIGSNGLPVPNLAHIGGLLIQEGNRVVGSGAVKRAGDTVLWPSRYEGDAVGERLQLTVTPLEDNPDAPRFSLDLVRRSANEMSGPASGDPGFQGTITLVRLGPRCFA